MVEKGPRPAPEIQLVDKLIEKTVRIGKLLENASVGRSVLHDVNQKLQAVDKKLDEMIQRESGRVQGIVVFEAPKPSEVHYGHGVYGPKKLSEKELGRIAYEVHDRERRLRGIPRRERKPEKSRGLKDPRPIEFLVPGTGKKLRGKEGKMVKSLKGARNRTLDRDQLAQRLQPGVKLETARVRVNTTARRARQSLHGSPLDIKITRDYERKTTNYSLVDRSKRKKKH